VRNYYIWDSKKKLEMKTKLRLLLLSVILPALPMYYTQAQEVTIEISVAEDAYLNYVNWYANPNSRSLIASAWTHNFSPGIGRSFIRFLLPELPPGTTNLKAYLNLYHDPNSGHTGHAYISPADENAAIIQRVTEPWNSQNMNWLNQPGVTSASSVILPKTNSSNQNFIGIDVTSMVEDCYDLEMTSVGMRISLLTEELYRSMIFASGNNPDPGRHPKLILTYDSCNDQLTDDYTIEYHGLNFEFYYDDNTATTINWDFGDGHTNSGSYIPHTYSEQGTYQVCMYAENECGDITVCKEIVVCNLLQPTFDYVADDLKVSFNAGTGEGILNYQWDFGNGLTSTQVSPVVHFVEAGTYFVCLSLTDHCTTETICEEIQLKQGENDTIPSPNYELVIFPNPTLDVITIRDMGSLLTRVDVFNTLGMLVYRLYPIPETTAHRFNIQVLPAGVYYFRLGTNFGTQTERVVVVK
jgi:hypothetical protein